VHKGTRLQRTLWMGLYLIKRKNITFEAANEALGIRMSTYRRYLRDLREAGMILNGVQGTPEGCRRNGPREGGTRYIASDLELAGIRVSA
jgi:predicted DNA-binding transcriptional regulator YafY